MNLKLGFRSSEYFSSTFRDSELKTWTLSKQTLRREG